LPLATTALSPGYPFGAGVADDPSNGGAETGHD
jgi:hypothetical protein